MIHTLLATCPLYGYDFRDSLFLIIFHRPLLCLCCVNDNDINTTVCSNAGPLSSFKLLTHTSISVPRISFPKYVYKQISPAVITFAALDEDNCQRQQDKSQWVRVRT